MVYSEVHASPSWALFESHDEFLTRYRGRYGENCTQVWFAIGAYLEFLKDSPMGRKPNNLVNRFLVKLKTDFMSVIKTLSDLADALLASCVYTSDLTVTGEFLEGFGDTPVFMEYYQFFKTGDPVALRYVLTFCWLLKKLPMERPDLEVDAFRAWLQIETELKDLVFDQINLQRLKAIIHGLIDVKRFDTSVCLPKFGPGFVSEGVIAPDEKYRKLGLDTKLSRVFKSLVYRSDRGQESWVGLPPLKRRQSGKYAVVPKNYKSVRSIVMEPNARMFFQQEVLRWTATCMKQSLIARFVDLRDQIPNQVYALKGSYHYGLDTLDLSAASDRVHVDLVRAVFPRKLLFFFLGTRTSLVKGRDGKTYELQKFAPMGSALCFPTQTILFTGIALLGYMHTIREMHEDFDIDYWSANLQRFVDTYCSQDIDTYSKRFMYPRVFGDDIAVDSRTSTHVARLLEEFGLKVNSSKSFTGGQMVRESCGIYAYNGHDITPFLLKVNFSSLDAPRTYQSFIGAINNTGDFSYRRLSSYLLRSMKSYLTMQKACWVNDLIYFSEDRDSGGIYTTRLREPAIVREEPDKGLPHPYFQRTERLVVTVTGRKFSKAPGDDYAYDQWMRARLWSSGDDFPKSSDHRRPMASRFTRRWIPV